MRAQRYRNEPSRARTLPRSARVALRLAARRPALVIAPAIAFGAIVAVPVLGPSAPAVMTSSANDIANNSPNATSTITSNSEATSVSTTATSAPAATTSTPPAATTEVANATPSTSTQPTTTTGAATSTTSAPATSTQPTAAPVPTTPVAPTTGQPTTPTTFPTASTVTTASVPTPSAVASTTTTAGRVRTSTTKVARAATTTHRTSTVPRARPITTGTTSTVARSARTTVAARSATRTTTLSPRLASAADRATGAAAKAITAALAHKPLPARSSEHRTVPASTGRDPRHAKAGAARNKRVRNKTPRTLPAAAPVIEHLDVGGRAIDLDLGRARRALVRRARPRPALSRRASEAAGYLMVTDAGSVAAFGGLHYAGSLNRQLRHPIVGLAAAAGGSGYWLADTDGKVYPIGGAPQLGAMPAYKHHRSPPGRRVVGIVATADGAGYWLVTAGGGVFSFGDAHNYGSMSGTRLRAPLVGMAPTADGHGYWLAGQTVACSASETHGSSGRRTRGTPASPIVGIAATTAGFGYRLATSAGVVYDFGEAKHHGRRRAPALGAPVVAIATAPSGQGYWLLAANGELVAFGSARDEGGARGTLPYGQRVSAMAVAVGTPDKFSHTSSGAFGVTSPSPLRLRPPEAAALRPARPTGRPTARHPATTPMRAPVVSPGSYPAGARGYDVSWPQCGKPLPPHSVIAVVGVNGGWAFTGNPCFRHEAEWAGANLTTYINLNSPQGRNAAQWADGPAGKCSPGSLLCESYNYGYNTAQYSLDSAAARGGRSHTWWLDVETSAYWSSSQRANARVVAGALSALREHGLNAAVYSTVYQWRVITGGYVPGTAAWYPTGIATGTPSRWCSASSFAGGPVMLVQSAAGRFDGDFACATHSHVDEGTNVGR